MASHIYPKIIINKAQLVLEIEHFRPAQDQFKYLEDNTKNTSQLKLGASEGEEDDANIRLFWKLARS